MRILITGASGNLGTALVDALQDEHELVLSDYFPVRTEHEFRQADMRVLDQVLPLARGVDFIIHTPAWHGMHGPIKSQAEFWQLNVDGSFNIFQSALENGVYTMVWVSSISIDGWERDKYGFTKFVGEHLCGFYHRAHGRRVGIIRPGDFTPLGSDFIKYGERLLAGGVDRRDVAGAVIQAMRKVVEGDLALDWFEVIRDNPFTPEDRKRYEQEPLAVVEEYWPGSMELVEKYGVRLPGRVNVRDLSKTKDVLGFQPRYNFGTFLEELRERDRRGAPVR